METILNIWNNWTMIEKVHLGILLVLIFIIVVGLTAIFTKSKKLVLISTISTIGTGILTCITLFILNQFLDITITHIYKIFIGTITFINILSLGTLIGYYTQHSKSKDFNILSWKKDFQKDTFLLSFFAVLLFTAISVLTPTIILPLLVNMCLGFVIPWLNNFLLNSLYK